MSKEDKTYYIGFLNSFSDSDLPALFRFIRKMTDTQMLFSLKRLISLGNLRISAIFWAGNVLQILWVLEYATPPPVS